MPGRHDHREHRGLLLDFGGVPCVFVDDLPHNLEPARALGMSVIHKTSADQLLTDLERLLGIPLR